MKKLIITSLSALILLSGCNTFKGFGKDISKAGDKVSETAAEVEEEL